MVVRSFVSSFVFLSVISTDNYVYTAIIPALSYSQYVRLNAECRFGIV